jgi:hypothetical protein
MSLALAGPPSWRPRWTNVFWTSCRWARRPPWWPMPLPASALRPRVLSIAPAVDAQRGAMEVKFALTCSAARLPARGHDAVGGGGDRAARARPGAAAGGAACHHLRRVRASGAYGAGPRPCWCCVMAARRRCTLGLRTLDAVRCCRAWPKATPWWWVARCRTASACAPREAPWQARRRRPGRPKGRRRRGPDQRHGPLRRDWNFGFELQVALRFLREGRMQTLLIIVGVAAGVAVIAYISALISGLQGNTLTKTLGAQAHVSAACARRSGARPRAAGMPGTTGAHETQPRAQRLRSVANWQALVPLLEAHAGHGGGVAHGGGRRPGAARRGHAGHPCWVWTWTATTAWWGCAARWSAAWHGWPRARPSWAASWRRIWACAWATA